jgi:hypothetical protein
MRKSNVATGLARQRGRQLRADEALAGAGAKVFLQSRGRHLNDDKSPLIDLLSCLVCEQTMKLEKSSPDVDGRDIIQYRCKRCDRIELVRLFRRSRTAAS